MRECDRFGEYVVASLGVIEAVREQSCSEQRFETSPVARRMFGERPFQPPPALGKVTADIPEGRHRAGEPGVICRCGIGRPVERRTQVIVLGLEPVEPFESKGPVQRDGPTLRKLEEKGEVAAPRRVGLSRFHELLARVLPNGLEQTIPGLGLLPLLGKEQRLGHQAFDDVENGCLLRDVAVADPFGGVE